MKIIKIALFLVAAMFLPPLSAEKGSTARLWIEKGNTAWLEGDLERAATDYRQAIAADSAMVLAHRKLAGLELVRHNLPVAITAFQKAISLDPSDATPFIGLGLAYLHQARYGEAHAALSEALRIDPTQLNAVEPVLSYIEAKQPHDTPRYRFTEIP